MFLLPCLVLGVALAIALGGTIARVLEVTFRAPALVVAAMAVQVVALTPLGGPLPDVATAALHVLSYALLLVFALLNLRLRSLWPVFAGMALNALAIAANGGRMPVSPAAAKAAGLDSTASSNVSENAERLWFLGDVFALPDRLPLANVFSVGDLLIGFGMAAFVIQASLGPSDEPTLSPARLLEPLRISTFRRLAVGKLVSHLGDWLTLAALVGWLYSETSSTEHVAGLLLVRLGPPILGGSIAAYLVDRLPKRNLLIVVELARGFAVGAALVGVFSGELTLVYAALAVSGGLAALSAAAVPAMVPSLVPDSQLPAANATLEIFKDGAMALGAAAAGVALASVGAEAALIADLATFALATLCYLGLPLTTAASDDEEPRPASAFRYVLGRRRLLILIFSFATATLATGLTNASPPRFFGGDDGLGAAGYGFAIAALATGLLLGETLIGVSRVGPTAGRWIGAALIVMAGLFGLLALTVHVPTALLLLAFIGFVDGTTDVLFDTVAQRETDPRYLGSVFGFASAFMAATMTGAFVAAPVLNGVLDSELVLLVAGAVLALAGAIALVGMRGTRERATAAASPVHIRRAGDDLSLVVCGAALVEAEQAAEALAPGLSIEVLTVADTSSLDLLVASVRRTSKVAVFHDGNGSGPLAAEVAATLGEAAWHDLDAPVTRIAPSDDLVARLRALAAY